MTICAAAVCQVFSRAVGKPEDMMLGISDRMLTSGDIEFEALQTKIGPFHSGKACCLFAGDAIAHDTVFAETHRVAKEGNVLDIAALARLYAENFMSLRTRRAEQLHLAPRGLSLRTFRASQNKMNLELVLGLDRLIADEALNLEAIVAGVDAEGAAHIYRITDPGVEECFDQAGFCAIGSGARQFESQFMYRGYSRCWAWLNALLLMYSAKKMAERSPGVGPATDMWMIYRGSGSDIPPQYYEVLEECHKELQSTMDDKTKELVTRMAADPRITGSPPKEQGELRTGSIDISAGANSPPSLVDRGDGSSSP